MTQWIAWIIDRATKQWRLLSLSLSLPCRVLSPCLGPKMTLTMCGVSVCVCDCGQWFIRGRLHNSYNLSGHGLARLVSRQTHPQNPFWATWLIRPALIRSPPHSHHQPDAHHRHRLHHHLVLARMICINLANAVDERTRPISADMPARSDPIRWPLISPRHDGA